MRVFRCTSAQLLALLNREVAHTRVLRRYLHDGRLRVSNMFQPMSTRQGKVTGSKGKELTCKSQRLMLQTGLIRQAHPGTFHLMAPALRAVEKLVRLVDQEMASIGGQKVEMPTLTPGDLWKATDRWDTMGTELFKLQDRHKADYCLGPTHEEAVTEIVAAQSNLSYKQLPIKVYQITRKFRDERRPRFGLLRGREFLMKDLYTFDTSEETACDTYEGVGQAYSRVFNRLGLDYVRVEADPGDIGGSLSHEYHLPADIGEDQLLVCAKCSFGANKEAMAEDQTSCPSCSGPLSLTQGIEVGHTFYLGTKYSSVFNASFLNNKGQPQLCEMGCYGLGMTRILAAALEVLSLDDQIRWPGVIAPYQVYIIPPKKGSKEESASQLAEELCDIIPQQLPHLRGEILLDDRSHMTIGKRLKDANVLGYPYVIVVGKQALESDQKFELIQQTEQQTQTHHVSRTELLQLLSKSVTI
ncbi:PREDICTED: probable proline--tRNA ligase, mitochondrial [Branchiostoma belcheri]|uniref:Probable proline--tRNA ligase, mitochondrial n=1 Tax=Branchiostoma belcheri TaxID=7741 RepID=A0A6P4ZYP9_BRABE|nr:PREDICTED: probable proline--tRNA ligase, mitochondrial [Branchiostoma belcheri]